MPATATTVSLFQIISVSLGSSVLAAGLSQWFTGRRERVAEAKDGRFAAYELALEFEAYAASCSDIISDSETYVSSRGAGGKEHYRLPPLPDFPEVNWRTIGIVDTVRANSFRTDLDFHHGYIASNAEYAGPGLEWEIAKIVRHRAAEVGLEASEIAQRLRKDKGITPLGNTRVIDHLKEVNVTYARERERDEREDATIDEPSVKRRRKRKSLNPGT